jgi:hypothetical protein
MNAVKRMEGVYVDILRPLMLHDAIRSVDHVFKMNHCLLLVCFSSVYVIMSSKDDMKNAQKPLG